MYCEYNMKYASTNYTKYCQFASWEKIELLTY